MSNYEDGCYITATGKDLIAKALSGNHGLEYTRAAVGKGTLPDGVAPGEMTASSDYVANAKILGITNPASGQYQVTVQLSSADVDEAFDITNIVLYAKATGENASDEEIAVTYLLLENSPEEMKDKTAAVGKVATFDIVTMVDDIDRVTAVLDPNTGNTEKIEITDYISSTRDGFTVGGNIFKCGRLVTGYLEIAGDITQEMIDNSDGVYSDSLAFISADYAPAGIIVCGSTAVSDSEPLSNRTFCTIYPSTDNRLLNGQVFVKVFKPIENGGIMVSLSYLTA